MERGHGGRFVGYRAGIVELTRRLSSIALHPLFEDPRPGIAYVVDWRDAGSPEARWGHPPPPPLRGEVRRVGDDAVEVTLGRGRPQRISVVRWIAAPRGGLILSFVCPACRGRTRFLYVAQGRLSCWRCAGLAFGCEGRRRERLARAMLRVIGHPVSLPKESPWDARVSPPAGGSRR